MAFEVDDLRGIVDELAADGYSLVGGIGEYEKTWLMGAVGPRTVGGTPVTLHVYVEDVDAVFARALELGATEVQAVTDQFYGDRSGLFDDPWGHRWDVATHVEDVPPEEMGERAKAAMG